MICECTNVIHRKVRLEQLTEDEARFAAQVLAASTVEILPVRHLAQSAVNAEIQLNYSAYDCVYLALALEQGRSL